MIGLLFPITVKLETTQENTLKHKQILKIFLEPLIRVPKPSYNTFLGLF
jgi:hypothetical protein